MSAIMKPEQSAVVRTPPETSEHASVLAIIERASRDPSVDLDKMERLIAMRDRMMAERARGEFAVAMAEMQGSLPTITKRGEIHDKFDRVQSRYARWEDINRAILPVLQAHGFALTFRNTNTNTSITVTGVISHRSGHREETSITLPTDTSGNKNAVQAVASAVSYGKRYTTGLLLNITACGEDDDGTAAGQAPARPVTVPMPRRASASGNVIDVSTIPPDLPLIAGEVTPESKTSVYIIESMELKTGTTPGKDGKPDKPWKLGIIRTGDEVEFTTFDTKIWAVAEALKAKGSPAAISYEPGRDGKALRAVAIREAPEKGETA